MTRSSLVVLLAALLITAGFLYLLLGATGRLIDRELDQWTPATAPGATPVPAEIEP